MLCHDLSAASCVGLALGEEIVESIAIFIHQLQPAYLVPCASRRLPGAGSTCHALLQSPSVHDSMRPCLLQDMSHAYRRCQP